MHFKLRRDPSADARPIKICISVSLQYNFVCYTSLASFLHTTAFYALTSCLYLLSVPNFMFMRIATQTLAFVCGFPFNTTFISSCQKFFTLLQEKRNDFYSRILYESTLTLYSVSILSPDKFPLQIFLVLFLNITILYCGFLRLRYARPVLDCETKPQFQICILHEPVTFVYCIVKARIYVLSAYLLS